MLTRCSIHTREKAGKDQSTSLVNFQSFTYTDSTMLMACWNGRCWDIPSMCDDCTLHQYLVLDYNKTTTSSYTIKMINNLERDQTTLLNNVQCWLCRINNSYIFVDMVTTETCIKTGLCISMYCKIMFRFNTTTKNHKHVKINYLMFTPFTRHKYSLPSNSDFLAWFSYLQILLS